MPTTTTTKPTNAHYVELILRQIKSLPTLPTIATRLLTLTASDTSHARQVIELIGSDPVLTAKILSLCRKSHRGVRDEALTIDKAVVLLGFNAIRNAVLSIKVFETFEQPSPIAANRGVSSPDLGNHTAHPLTPTSNEIQFDRVNFWRHSLAVGIAAELIAAGHPDCTDLGSAEAFVCGLLHDIGKIALDHVLPKSYARVIELAELNQGNIAELERRIMGLDHYTAGKRLAEQWQLPYQVQDCIWLHGSAYQTLPKLDHRRMIGLVSLADLIVRRHHIGFSGNFILNSEDPYQLAKDIGLNPQVVDSITHQLHEQLQRRAETLGLDDEPSHELFLKSIQQANQMLGRLNSTLERRSKTATRQAQVLDSITQFHSSAVPGHGVQAVLDLVVDSASTVLGPGYYALLHQPYASEANNKDRSWLVCQYNDQAQSLQSQLVQPPPHSPELTNLDPNQPMSMNLMGILPWIADYLLDAPNLRQVQLLPLGCGWGTVAVLLHDRPQLPPQRLLRALTTCWGASIASAGQHEGARRLGEELVEANRALAEAQDRLLHTKSMARVGEMAAGAAHEMNNPLAVIAGRSQMLTQSLEPGSKPQQAAKTIFEQSHRLSDLITLLRLLAESPQPNRRLIDMALLLDQTVKQVRHKLSNTEAQTSISLQLKSTLPPISVDPDQISQIITELLLNAIQALPQSCVHVTARIDPTQRHLLIQITDDGKGMDSHTLSHAIDPFFSAKSAGRRIGMGLTRSEQLALAHNGKIELRSELKVGTVVTLTLPLDSPVGLADTSFGDH